MTWLIHLPCSHPNRNHPIPRESWSATGLRVPQLMPASPMTGLLLQNLSHLFNWLSPWKRADLPRFGINIVVFTQILWRSCGFWLDLVILLRSNGFYSNLAKIQQKNVDHCRLEPPTTSLLALTDLTADQLSLIQLDLWVFSVSNEFSSWQPDVIGSVVGWAQTWPGSTRGHP